MKAGEWALVSVAEKLGQRFEVDWRNITPERRTAWARLLLFGVVAVIAALYGAIALLVVGNRGVTALPWEHVVLRLIEGAPIGFSSAVWFQTLGSDFMLLTVVITSAGLAAWNGRPLLALTIVLTLIFMDAIVRVGWFSLARARPAIIAEGLAAPGFHSFPSGHTAKTIAVYGLLAAQWFQASRSAVERSIIAVLALMIFVVVPYARMRMGVHWPTDVLGGSILGGLWLLFAVTAAAQERRS